MVQCTSRVVLSVSLAAMLFGCSSAAGPGRCRVLVVLQASKDANPARTGESLPTTVRFYQLKEVTNLRKATYEDLWTHAPEVLGADLSDVQEAVVYPADRMTQVLPVKDDAVYLAAAAFFRSPEGVTWRTYATLPELGTVKRCAEDKPGGPYYFAISGTSIRGSREPPPVSAK